MGVNRYNRLGPYRTFFSAGVFLIYYRFIHWIPWNSQNFWYCVDQWFPTKISGWETWDAQFWNPVSGRNGRFSGLDSAHEPEVDYGWLQWNKNLVATLRFRIKKKTLVPTGYETGSGFQSTIYFQMCWLSQSTRRLSESTFSEIAHRDKYCIYEHVFVNNETETSSQQ